MRLQLHKWLAKKEKHQLEEKMAKRLDTVQLNDQVFGQNCNRPRDMRDRLLFVLD
jgi:hypothetical protein